MSFRARGVLAFLIAKPDDWRARTESIAKEGTEGRDAVRKAVMELKAAGYYRVVTERQKDGTLIRYTEVYDVAQEWAAEEYGDQEAGRLARKLRRRLEGEAADRDGTDAGNSGVGESGVGSPVAGDSGIITSTHTKDPQEIPPTPTPSDAEGLAAPKGEDGGPTAAAAEPPVPTEEHPQGQAGERVRGSCRAHEGSPGRSCRACGTSPRVQAQRQEQAEKEKCKAAAAASNARVLESVRRRPGRDGMSEATREEWAQARALMIERKTAAREGNIIGQPILSSK
ncbi:hypothetical protein [Streptomyces abikoensis]|uniref:Helix-turn-helix domain-containing protein n=1 Tax=Streptomyces abikoensis TaxID=97398 RepID=A0ABW7T4K5_9ACTN